MNRRDAEKASSCRRLLYMVAELAAKFVDQFPDIAKEAMGRDSEYVRWYREMLVATEPDGLIYAYADWPGR